jgi:hypothetical protein
MQMTAMLMRCTSIAFDGGLTLRELLTFLVQMPSAECAFFIRTWPMMPWYINAVPGCCKAISLQIWDSRDICCEQQLWM